ncbi:ATP:cob(I)alamin adenosyltransferase, partial [candidate division KSB1 bacterium]|nr:ATP:cob(I)alamin adenosyltransferase [candidate division KSB1 bacterium]
MRSKKISTRKGDDGSTGLLNGRRVDKCDPRPEAYGTLDEAHAFIGLARAKSTVDEVRASLLL